MHFSRTVIVLCAALCLNPPALASPTGVLVNGVELTEQQVQYYQIMVPAGRYWYDRVSGLWGLEGGPNQGQMAANLDLGGPLRADASDSETGVFINGRQIHPLEIQYLGQLLQQQIPLGRYWLRYDGVGGIEGGPPTFSLFVGGGGGGQSSPVFEDQVADFCAEVGGCPW